MCVCVCVCVCVCMCVGGRGGTSGLYVRSYNKGHIFASPQFLGDEIKYVINLSIVASEYVSILATIEEVGVYASGSLYNCCQSLQDPHKLERNR